MPKLNVILDDIIYCVGVDFDELKGQINHIKSKIAEQGKLVRDLRHCLDRVSTYPHLPSVINAHLNILKLEKCNLEFYKLEQASFKAVLKNKNCYTIFANKEFAHSLTQLRSQYKSACNDKLELLEDTINNGYTDEGQYLHCVNDTKNTYEGMMNYFDIFDKLLDPNASLYVEE